VRDGPKPIEERPPIVVVTENHTAFQTPKDHVVQCSGGVEARAARHEGRIPRRLRRVKFP
jgi:hypothetical protein